MPTTKEKTRENLLRRAAKRRGFDLVKVTSECWLVVDLESRTVVSGVRLMSIRDVATFLDVQ